MSNSSGVTSRLASEPDTAFVDVGNEGLRFGVEFQGVEWHTGKEREDVCYRSALALFGGEL